MIELTEQQAQALIGGWVETKLGSNRVQEQADVVAANSQAPWQCACDLSSPL
jgi:hypothetical protein